MRSKALHILSILLLAVGIATTAKAQTHLVPTPDEEKNGITFNGNTYKPLSKIKIAGDVYGGGDKAAVQGNTNVTISTGEYGGSIFGGGNGELEADGVTVKHSADIGTHNADGTLKDGTGETNVTINGGEIVYYVGDKDNFRNIYGGGNMACNVAGNTHVTMNKGMITAWSFVSSDLAVAAWQHFWDNHNSNTKQPVCAVFGAGYGANTDVAQDTHVDINLGETRTEEYTETDLVAANNFVTRDGPNPALSQKFVSGVFGGGYNGTVGAFDKEVYAANPTGSGINRDNDATRDANDYLSNTNVNLKGSPYTFTIFGGGLGSEGAANRDVAAAKWGSRVGAVFGGTKVNVEGGFVFGSVFGGGAGIYGAVHITTPREGDMPYINAAQVFRETDVTINGAGTVVIGNVYGGGDIANTGWYTAGTRPTETAHKEQVNMSLAKLDYTTSVHLLGGNVMGQVFGGANGRTKKEITLAHLIGAVIGSTNLQLGEDIDQTDGKLHGTTVWNRIYGGCNVGQVYACKEIATNRGQADLAREMATGVTDGCTNLAVYNGKMAHDIFAGGYGDVNDNHTPDDKSDDVITSADISGNTYVYFKKGDLEWEHYWDAQTADFIEQSSAIGHWGEEQDVCHNLYGGGNIACVVKGNSHVFMTGAPAAPANFINGDYWKACIANVALPHFSVFGGGFGINAKINGNAYSDINLRMGSGFHSIIGGGMNGPVVGMCKVHVGNDPLSRVHHVYGGGYYAPCEKTELDITRGTIVENVFGGSVMGNITPYKRDNDGNLVLSDGKPIPDIDLYATKTTIGLQDEGAGRHSTIDLTDEHDNILRSYTYDDHKNQITIGGNVYGANDVSGTVNGMASLTIYGGTIQGQVYGAGNGNHIGYYVPGELKYNMGAHGDANYFYVDHGTIKGNTYVGRPQTIGGVELTLEGNTTMDRVKVLGQVFGGGNSCTIGTWDKTLLSSTYAGNPHLVRDDPDYFQGGGKLYVNIGSHVTIGRTHQQLKDAADGNTYIDNDENVSGLFMGCSGRNLATQNGDYEHDNYYHHFYNYNAGKYYPGFAVGDEGGTPMTRADQLKPFQAYLNNVMVWSDDVHLRINNHDGSAAEDVWLANFVGGGFRGSMRAMTEDGKFDYTLPEGVTIGHTVVGGAYNAHVQYHYFDINADGTFKDTNNDGVYDYATVVPDGWNPVGYDTDHPENGDYIKVLKEDSEHPDQITSIIRYNFNGGILSENSMGVTTSEVGNHIHKVHADPRAEGITDEERKNRYATSYFEPMPETSDDPNKEDDATRAALFTANKDKVLMHLDLQCALEPEVLTDAEDETYLHGGNVFGGCFLSGFVEGDSWVDYNCWLSPECTDPKFFSKDKNWEIYAEAMDIERNNALNAYGAGYGTDTHSMGDVYLSVKAIEQTAGGDGDVHGHFPYMFNAFGGSNMGEVDGNVNVYYAVGKQGTLLGSLYGGGFKGDIHGNTFVELAEGFVNNVYGGSRQANIGGAAHVWAYDGKARGIDNANHLIICNLYGGNDIAGTISGEMPAYFTESKWSNSRESMIGHTFNTYVEISADDESADRGFPLVGSAFAGGNGEAWVSETASGAKPDVAKALIEIEGGSTLRAFGGGNMATVTGETFIFTDAKSKNFADVTFTEYQKNIVQNIFFRDVTVGYKWEDLRLTMDDFHVARLFGGNNLATMDIQPTWNLKNGRLENVYSGGNMGDMTYYNPAGKPSTKNGTIGETAGVENNADGSNANYSPRGLSITIDQPDIYIGSLFGGCRLSDVKPTPKSGQEAWPEGNNGEDFYGATVNILDGYIENVYGGNDISGTVYHGTNVNISGAVSGNVYGSGNGFYLYKLDKDINWGSTTANPYQTNVIEEFDQEHKELVYHVKPLDAYGGNGANDTQKILAINSYRPSVEKAFLNIAGLEHYPVGDSNPKRVAYVKGNVFCGGNASTIIGNGSFSKFKIGSYVTLNGVFMGSDGKAFTDNDHIARFASLNGITDMGAATTASSFLDWNGTKSDDASHNPILLNTYMMAVDMKAQPKDFNLNLPLKEAHIGTYCGGGNRGSMLVDKTVSLPFHHDIIIYDKIVGACLDANVKYNQNGTTITSYGGYTREIADHSTYGNTKMRLNIASQFVPLVMDVPDNKDPETKNSHGESFDQAKVHDFLYDNRKGGVKYTYTEFNELFDAHFTSQEDFEANEGVHNQWKVAPDIYAPSCNIYGGCYQSGEVEGDIELNVFSNMLRYVNKADLDKSLAENIACFNVYGAGFGQDSHVWGNVHINMDRSLDTSTMGTIGGTTVSDELAELLGAPSGTPASSEVAKWDIMHSTTAANNLLGIANANTYPSFNNVIGGGRNGKLIGNTTVEIRNGLVYSDVAGGCYASDMYGSTQVIVGYPKYYQCKTSGTYNLDRADKWNTTKKDGEGNDVIKQSVSYLKGDLVPDNVYQQIVAHTSGNASYFDEITFTPATNHSTDGTTWDDVHIKIGKGIYGGGYSLADSKAASAGSITTHKLVDDATTTKDIHPHNFSGRYGYDETAFAGYGGNSSVMLGDMDKTLPANSSYDDHDHIRVSTLNVAEANIPAASSVIGKFIKETVGGKEVYTHQGDHTPVGGTTYYTLTGEGGVYGDGHLTFCEGFRSADVTRYGWADGTAKHPILMNTFQRMDLLSVNDCCLMLQGAQDFATDQIDATVYSITRINEMRLNSTLDAGAKLGEISNQNGVGGEGDDFGKKKQRNYLAFFNNVHYLGSIVTNDKFDNDVHTFHDEKGNLGTISYKAKKQEYITAYENSELLDGKKTVAATEAFKMRNVATARNAIGINNGYCLRVQNQEYEGTGASKVSKTYYGPIVGVCEVKLLTLVQGEGGGYVYADNIHEYPDKATGENHFLMSSGNFVFPGIVNSDPEIGNQYIVDDCFIDHFGTPSNITQKDGPLDEAHYWYVEGNKYFFTTTLTGFTYKKDAATPMFFNLTKTDPNVILSGMETGSKLNVKKIEWLSTESGFHRNGYDPVLPNTTNPNDDSDYEFDIEVGGSGVNDWKYDLPRATNSDGTTGKKLENEDNPLPQLNIKLTDKVDNSGDAAYINHLDEPELVKIYLEGDNNGQKYEYTITVNVVYLQGPTVTGGVRIENCALPGELIGFSTSGLVIKTPELMPITASSWQILPLKQINDHGVWEWDMEHGIVIPDTRYGEDPETREVVGNIPALYKQNEYNIAYIFTAGGYDFSVMPDQTLPAKENRMIVVHNYHRMKDVVTGIKGSTTVPDLQIETMPEIDNNETHQKEKHQAEAKLYIEDEEDLRAFIEYLNMATESNAKNIPVGLTGLDIILQKDIKLTSELPTISQAFAGTFHGDGYHINLNGKQQTLFGNKLTGKVYNLGIIAANGATIASTGTVTNSYVSGNVDANDLQYGREAYRLSHVFTPTTDASTYANYVATRYANGDYQYAATDRVWSLRTDAPNYGHEATRHDQTHTHDAARWVEAEGINKPLYDGTLVVADNTVDISGNGTDYFTYRGLPVGYANDYLFFGQHLDKTSADAYPMHIDPVATSDPDYAKGGNRVFKTAGYYQSKQNQQFYYNKDAWALYPELTAIDYTSMIEEDDGAETLPTKFSVDSNMDYDTYSNATEGHVTQNLLVYHDSSEDAKTVFAEGSYADNTPESDVRYHGIIGSGSAYNADYFHLVDKQDFNAPIAFNVTKRAWYERMPQSYRNVHTYGYNSGSAWEGIVLPFTATKVTAEKNGEISHFYGSSDLHHEYWLRGFKGTETKDTKTYATFASPAVSGDAYFKDSHQSGISYVYPKNDYFTSLFNYGNHYNTRDEDADKTFNDTDEEWYANSHTFADYVRLTAEVPYIVAFPGDDFYEFSMESYYKSDSYGSVAYRQKATFEAANASIKVSDDNAVSTTANGYTHNGTFLHKASQLGVNAEGTAFVAGQAIVPFRTYMTTSSSSAKSSRIIIYEGELDDDSDAPKDPEEELTARSMKIYLEGRVLVVESSYEADLRVYTPAGQYVRTLQVMEGMNRYNGFHTGVYIIGGKKVIIP